MVMDPIFITSVLIQEFLEDLDLELADSVDWLDAEFFLQLLNPPNTLLYFFKLLIGLFNIDKVFL